MNFAAYVLILSFLFLVLWCRTKTKEVPERDVEAVENVITSFVVVDGDKEYRWRKKKSGEPTDEGFIQETKFVEGDILKPPEMSTEEFNKRKMVEDRNLWQNGVIPWKFNAAERRFTDPDSYAKVTIAFKILESLTCLKFPRWSPEKAHKLGRNYVDVGQGSGCASYVGFYGKGPQPILLKEMKCIKIGVILHEICHSVGFYHEHSRTDRDEYIDIFFKNIKNSAINNFKIHANSNNYALYDVGSIMHYGSKAFSIGSRITIKPKDENLAFLLGQRTQLSFYDIETITEAYGCTHHCPRPHQRCTNGGFLNSKCKCHCPFGLKGVDCSSIINKKVCGGIVSLSQMNQEATISFSSKSLGGNKKAQCFWLIKAPSMTSIRLELLKLHLKKAEWMVCKQWLEIRYNMIGQDGPKYCGDLSGKQRLFQSSTHLVMLSFESTLTKMADAEFKMSVKLISKNDTDINCTFEKESMCIFHQVDNDDFDWILNQGPTPSKYTGPESGNNGSARYLYIESNSRRPGDAAILESRLIYPGNKCIAFHYNMYGNTVGELTMKLITEKNHSLDVFQESGSKGLDWQTYTFSLYAPLPFKIIIKATVGAGSSGDIAIDDISIKHRICDKNKKKLTLGKRIVTQIDCGFEVDACKFTWIPQSIAKVITSPISRDASLIGSLLIFTWTLKDGEKATVQSPVVPYHGISCLSIRYYVIGIARWNLSLAVADPTNNNIKILWSSSGMKEIKGRNNIITEEINESFKMIQVILTVMVPSNSSFISILAIDHVQLITSPCNEAQVRLPFACDFTQWCGFKPGNSDWVIATKGLLFGPFTGSYFRKKPFLLYQGILSKSSGKSSVTSPPIHLLGNGCLSFNFFARGILLKGIILQKKTVDDRITVVWNSKVMLMTVWSHIQIPLIGNGEFQLIFSTIGKDMFANYAIDNMKLNPMPCSKDKQNR